MSPLKITIKMGTPFVKNGYPIHLDSILGNAFVKHYLPDEDEHNEDAVMQILEELPIEKHKQDGQWVYKASALIPAEQQHSSRYFTRRYPEKDVAIATVSGHIINGKYKPGKKLPTHGMKIDTKRGHQKNILAYHPVTQTNELTCYCIGDKELIEEALTDWGYISHIGAQRRMGHGLISNISIEENNEAVEKWKLRTSPWELIENSIPLRCTVQNPYWDKTKAVNGYCPEIIF